MAKTALGHFPYPEVVNNYDEFVEILSRKLSSDIESEIVKDHGGTCDNTTDSLYHLNLDDLIKFDPDTYLEDIHMTVPFRHRPYVYRSKAVYHIDLTREHGSCYRKFGYTRSQGSDDYAKDNDDEYFGYASDETATVKERYKYVLPRDEDAPALCDAVTVDNGDDWLGVFEWTDLVHRINKEVFGNATFRPKQLEAINCILSGRDTFIVIPTGGGKSLCFQLPVVYDATMGNGGVTVAIVPLVSLIQDQMKRLTALGIPCHALIGELSRSERDLVFGDMRPENYTSFILFITPERLTSSKVLLAALRDLEKQNRLARFVIDEAHCVSQWGNDFRPDYKAMGLLKHEFPKVPVCALTATATPQVIGDVCNELRLKSPTLLKSNFNRPNLCYEVVNKDRNVDNAIKQLIELLKTRFEGKCGIIYCLSCNEVEKVTQELGKHIKVAPYHAQMNMNLRTSYYNEWISGSIDIMVATLAFGMGIDKSDVRFVIHFSMPKSIENYFQESGRAGRDGETAWCIIMYLFHDSRRLLTLNMQRTTALAPQQEQVIRNNILSVVIYCENSHQCRRKVLLEYFGEKLQGPCDVPCDSCSVDRDAMFVARNFQTEATQICNGLFQGSRNGDKSNNAYTMITLHKLLLQRKSDPHMLSGYLRNMGFTKDSAMYLLKRMVMHQLLIERVVRTANQQFPSFYIRVNPQYRLHLHFMCALRFPVDLDPLKIPDEPVTSKKSLSKESKPKVVRAKATDGKRAPKAKQPVKKPTTRAKNTNKGSAKSK
ncbi:Bloom syndrome -like protein [Babesia sp. Xinjiang]|uniref:Bloom syndrome -like protein n=1 Tax=Babesia sp. Xinjiang TaxID=462227 RepID=UPI000A21DDF6|nr:Bloom syndrome -like protein [Babesia sp. Xinjiang]ORM41709.1 Bloom syndrome -like protein [Babesia sp. Xinjiang]